MLIVGEDRIKFAKAVAYATNGDERSITYPINRNKETEQLTQYIKELESLGAIVTNTTEHYSPRDREDAGIEYTFTYSPQLCTDQTIFQTIQQVKQEYEAKLQSSLSFIETELNKFVKLKHNPVGMSQSNSSSWAIYIGCSKANETLLDSVKLALDNKFGKGICKIDCDGPVYDQTMIVTIPKTCYADLEVVEQVLRADVANAGMFGNSNASITALANNTNNADVQFRLN